MPDVTVKSIDDMEPIYGGLARRARAELGVTAWGMQVFTLPPDWDGYPNHNHSSEAFDPNQEEVYIPLSGTATLVADGSEFELHAGTMVRVGRLRPLRAPRAARRVAARDRDERLPDGDRAQTRASRRGERRPRIPAALSGPIARGHRVARDG